MSAKPRHRILHDTPFRFTEEKQTAPKPRSVHADARGERGDSAQWLAGINRAAAQIVITAVRVVRVTDDSSAPLDDAGAANPDFNFRFDATLGGTGGYVFNLSTKGFAAGTYRLFFTVAGDSAEHFAPFQVK